MVREFLFCSLILWQIGFIVYLLLNKFYQPKKLFTQPSVRPSAVEVEHIDIKMKKQILMDKTSKSNIVSDEVIKGKVTTQKDKLKKLRRGL